MRKAHKSLIILYSNQIALFNYSNNVFGTDMIYFIKLKMT